MWVFKRAIGPAFAALVLSGCITTSMQGYADRALPAKPIGRIAAYVVGTAPLVAGIQASIGEEARKRGLTAEDALLLLPPTRTYSDTEVRQALMADHVDGVLIVSVGDAGVQQQYAGTLLAGLGPLSGGASATSVNALPSGTVIATTKRASRNKRQTNFTARLVELATGRNLWVGTGQVDASGVMFVGDGASASNSVAAIFNDLQAKGIIGRSS